MSDEEEVDIDEERDPIKIVAGKNGDAHAELSRWGKTKKFLKEYVIVIFVIVLLVSYGVIDNVLDNERQENIRGDISSEREILDQAALNLEGILCLADRTDLLIDIELNGLAIEDLSEEEQDLLNTSCRDEAEGSEGKDQGNASDSEG